MLPRGTETLLPTAVKRPFWISACETTRLAGSIVWILPFTRTRSGTSAAWLRLPEQFRAAQSAEGERARAAEELSAPETVCRIFLSHVCCLPDLPHILRPKQ